MGSPGSYASEAAVLCLVPLNPFLLCSLCTAAPWGWRGLGVAQSVVKPGEGMRGQLKE